MFLGAVEHRSEVLSFTATCIFFKLQSPIAVLPTITLLLEASVFTSSSQTSNFLFTPQPVTFLDGTITTHQLPSTYRPPLPPIPRPSYPSQLTPLRTPPISLRPIMAVKWTAARDQNLLLLIIKDIKVDFNQLAQKWKTNFRMSMLPSSEVNHQLTLS